MKPIAIDLFCGLGGWSKGFMAEGYECIGFDIERHVYGEKQYPGQLVLQDALTLHGSQFKGAAAIVASPPCQRYSYMAMPWSIAKAQAAGIRADATGAALADLNALFLACFRLQREASEAAGHPIPLIVENVKGAQPSVGRARAHFGSFYLWGDVESVGGGVVVARRSIEFGGLVRAQRGQKFNSHGPNHQGSWFPISHGKDCEVLELQAQGVKQRGSGAEWFDTGICSLPSGSRGTKAAMRADPTGDRSGWFDEYVPGSGSLRNINSQSPRRKAASAQIAEIPYDLARYVARALKP